MQSIRVALKDKFLMLGNKIYIFKNEHSDTPLCSKCSLEDEGKPGSCFRVRAKKWTCKFYMQKDFITDIKTR